MVPHRCVDSCHFCEPRREAAPASTSPPFVKIGLQSVIISQPGIFLHYARQQLP
ncbi:hypothetical protein [Burkholderia sp. LMU1-1-1.1]|uniref:hypothetical protein n=1 Tax=Burkholderia sp. LMU1-1-1.1 TaxID=3135266 RepID=UPI003435F0B7